MNIKEKDLELSNCDSKMWFSLFHDKTLNYKGELLEKIKLSVPENHDVKGDSTPF